MVIKRFEDIKAWQTARDLAREVYTVTRTGGFSHDYGLRDQITRAAGSIMHNIAEGFDAGSNPEFVRFLGYAKRSCTEVQSQLYVALDQDYLADDLFNRLYRKASEARAATHGFIVYLHSHAKQRSSTNPEP